MLRIHKFFRIFYLSCLLLGLLLPAVGQVGLAVAHRQESESSTNRAEIRFGAGYLWVCSVNVSEAIQTPVVDWTMVR